ncbi:hypothetical protein TWF718_000068 [Orbilia javanica]|uniref:Uncharacterized protein n=1 Tax=Orbilia javanica TaxID=47235 RepID=A0AAN8P0N1_9PEZI
MNNSNRNQLPEDAACALLLRENRMLKITILELQIAQCRNLAIIDRFVSGQLNDPNGGLPSNRQRLLQTRMEELEASLVELRSEGEVNENNTG